MLRVLIFVLLAAAAAAQQPLTVTFSALDKKGQPVENLRVEDVRIEHDGKLLAVQELRFDPRQRLDVVVLFDVSHSQRSALDQIRDAAGEVLRQLQLRRSDRLSMVVFSDRVHEERAGIDLDAADKMLYSAWPVGTSAIFDSIERTRVHFTVEPGFRRVVLLLSDGEDSASQKRSPADVPRGLAEAGAVLFAVDLNPMVLGGQPKAAQVLDRMAHASGGESCYPRTEGQMKKCAAMVAAAARATYLATLAADRLPAAHKLKIMGPKGVRILAPTRHAD